MCITHRHQIVRKDGKKIDSIHIVIFELYEYEPSAKYLRYFILLLLM